MESETSLSTGYSSQEPPLSPLAARVLGCLLEKEIATPDIYPLSLNALTNACNQRSNRSPVIAASAAEVEIALQELRMRKLVMAISGADSRVQKFRHRLPEAYDLTPVEQAILCELLVRGPQTAAGLRSNAERLRPMPENIELLLEGLSRGGEGALVKRLARQSGQKEGRWGQLLSGEPVLGEGDSEEESVTVKIAIPEDVEQRLASLEAEVVQLRGLLQEVRRGLGMGESGSTPL
jgi:uncharacterized protein YceH (UPF0502 family)